jgi:DNA-binding NarL/FixJ family response regulator
VQDVPEDLELKVLVVEDHSIVIAGCRAMFADDPAVHLLAARTVAEGRRLQTAEQPDVTVIDINLPDGSGLDLARDLSLGGGRAKVIVFTMSDAPVLAMQAIENGAQGYVSKSGNPEELREAVYAVHSGGRWLPDALLQEVALLRVDRSRRALMLSDRQIQILKALVRGKSMAEIADELDVCYKTVATDCSAMRTKLNARTSSEMVRVAAEMKIV